MMKPDSVLSIINQLHLLESKIRKQPELGSGLRQLERIKGVLESEGYIIDNPQGESYDGMRSDLDVGMSADPSGMLKITEVIKPVVYIRKAGENSLLQRGIVIVG